MKLASDSKRQQTPKKPPRLSTLLTRKTSFELVTNDHLPYLWAAYRKGSFKDIYSIFVDDLSKEEFVEVLAHWMEGNGLTGYMLFSEVNGKIHAVGFATFCVRGRIMQT